MGSSGTPERITQSLTTTKLLDLFGRPDVQRHPGTRTASPRPTCSCMPPHSLGFDPRDCVVVEDSPYGIEAARAAGMTVIGYAGGVIPVERLADADVVIDSMADLPAHRRADLSAEIEPSA